MYEDTSETFTSDMCRSNLSNSLSPHYGSIWGMRWSSGRCCFFFFNFFLNSKSCIIWVTVGYFVRKILFCYLFFNKYVWKVKQFFENLDSMALRLDLLVFFYLKLGIWFEEFCPHTGLPLQYQAVLTCAVVFDYFAQCVLVTSCPMSWGYY